MKRFFVLAGIALAMLFQLSCSQDEELAQPENPTAADVTDAFNAAPFAGDVQLEDMSEAEVRALSVKTPLEMITVLEGTSKVKLQVRFRGVRDSSFGFPLYECEYIDASAEALGGVAQGMSGSPVGPPGRVMGALAYGGIFDKPPYRFWVTPIDAMKAAIAHPTFGEFLEQPDNPAAPGIHATYAPVKTPMMITGIQPHRIQELASHLSASQFNFVELYAHIGGAPAAPAAGHSPKLAAGDMIGVAVSTGDVVNSIGFGTVAQVYDDKFVAFGHPMSNRGQAALPVYKAAVDGIVPNLQVPYKSSYAIGNPIGTVTKDLLPGIVGELGSAPAMIPVTVSYHPANNTVMEKHHVVAYGYESYIPIVAAVTMDTLRMENSPGTVEGSVTLHFKETEEVYSEPFRSTSPHPFFDVLITTDFIVQSFTERLQNSAGKATLKAVSIVITDKPQIASAEIDEVNTPMEVMPGETLPVTITLVPHWSTAKNGRTIEREILLEIPEDFPGGEARLVVSGGSGGSDFLGEFGPPPPGFIVDFGFDEDDEERPVPQTLDELIEQKREDQVDPGLITVTLTSTGFGGDFPEPEDFPEMGELPENGEPPEELPPPPEELPELEDFPPPGAFPFPGEFEPPPSVDSELVIDGFVVFGFKETELTIKAADEENGMMPPEDEDAEKEAEE